MSGPEEEDDADVIVFSDEEGNEVAFEILGEVEVEGGRYALMTPASYEDEVEIDVHIFRVDAGADGEDAYSDDIDEAMFEKVRIAAEQMFEDEDGDEDGEADPE